MQNLTLKAKGLISYPNNLSAVPNGSLLQADNVVIDREEVLEPRRGYNQLPGTLGSVSTYLPNQIFKFAENVIAHYGVVNTPSKLAHYTSQVYVNGVQTSGSNVISNLSTVSGLYVGQTLEVSTIDQAFSGTIALGSNQITNVTTTRGLYVGQTVGGLGIPANTTISSFSGSGPYTITMSNVATYTKQNCVLVASNSNILGFPANTTITNVGTTSITVSNNATQSSRTFTFTPSDVDTGTNVINVTNNGLNNGDTVQFSTSGTLPSPLIAGTVYYVVNASNTDFQVSLTSGGAAVDLTTQGTGTHTLTVRTQVSGYGWIDYSGTYLQPSVNVKLRSCEANNNVYFTTFEGIKKLDLVTNPIVAAGVPKGLDGYAILAAGTTGFMEDDTQVGYQVVWGYKDANKNLLLGAPSQVITVANNSGSTRDVVINFTVPSDITTNYFYQVYRTGFSASANDSPSGDLRLVYEANPTGTDITNKYVVFTDQTPESLRIGATLYTSASQETATQANYQPPYAKDIALFKGSTFYANTKTRQNLTLTILSVSGQFSFFGNTTNVVGDTPTTVRSLAYSVTGTLTSGSNVITSVSDVSSLYVGQTISDSTNPSYLPADTVITAILSSSSIQVSAAATTSSVGDTLSIGVTGLLVGQQVSGTGIPASTTITQVYSPFTSVGDTHSNMVIDNITSTAGFKVGQIITGTDIPADTVVTAITSPTSITISKNATGTTAALSLNLQYGFQISNAATATGTSTLTVQNGTNGIEVNDTITVAGTTFTAKLVENIAAKEFKLYAQGSPAQNIADTAQSLIRVVNRTTSPVPSVNAIYLSGFNDLPGRIFFEERVFGGGTYYATANSVSAGTAYSPALPGPGGTTVSSTNDEFGNGLYFSKTNQPEAVPIVNFTKVGSAHAQILRILPLRDSLFILKEDGIYRLTGESPTSFRVDLFDSTTQIICNESAVSLNNLIFMLSRQGIVSVSDTGVVAISRKIEDKINDLFEIDLDKTKNLSFGISYESDRKYILYTITESTDEYCTQAYVYNVFTETWTRWVKSHTCGIVDPSLDLLFMGSAINNTFDEERKTRTYTDYTDSSFTLTLIQPVGDTSSGSPDIINIPDTSYFEIGQSVTGIGIPTDSIIIALTSSTITLNKNCTSTGTTALLQDGGKTLALSSLDNIEVGDVLYQTEGRFSAITVINEEQSTVTVNDFIENWSIGSITLLKAFANIVKYVPQTAENPGTIKQFREATLLFQVPYFNRISLNFSTDLSNGDEEVPLNGVYGTLWGRFKWGQIPWGGTTKAVPIRTYVPQQKQRCSLLNVTLSHREAYSFYRLNGVSFQHNSLSERVGR